jgi:hypothetical protein
MLKKTALFLFLSLLIITGTNAQDLYKTTTDSQGNKVLIGQINVKQLANDSAFRWFYQGVNSYAPNTEWTKYISYYRDSFNVVVFAGTWDEASRKLLPAFYRVMLTSSYPADKIKLYAVDHQLHALGDEAQQFHIQTLPTIILLHNGNELGRIQQKPVQSLEANMAGILQSKFLSDSTETGGSGQ